MDGLVPAFQNTPKSWEILRKMAIYSQMMLRRHRRTEPDDPIAGDGSLESSVDRPHTLLYTYVGTAFYKKWNIFDPLPFTNLRYYL